MRAVASSAPIDVLVAWPLPTVTSGCLDECYCPLRLASTLHERRVVPPDPTDIPAGLRQQAAHARALAEQVSGDEAAERLEEYASELEQRAATLERDGQ
jgi:hypothetical protein